VSMASERALRERRVRLRNRRRNLPLYIMIGIIMIYYLMFHYYPIFMGVLMSFSKMKIGMTPFDAPWVGIENFLYIITDNEIMRVVQNTLILSVLRLVWGFWPPIVLAIAIFDITSGAYKRICQTIVY